ncbi:MAG TPA: glycosyltransferase family 1 protein [Thermoanaerobaculia bacterium]|jgi:glycosyltransferase involved in cell wall biosynthesis|nr:glycosyltransferase family 1 protein [Thermoanaerobaculia bacterium]
MRVAIDCRKIADYGIGTYIRGLLSALREVELVALGPESIAPLLPAGVEHVVVEAPHYSLRELLVVGRAAERARVDLFHAPHYVLPSTRCPSVVTIHDLIHLHHPPRNPAARLYARVMLGRAVRLASRVLTVSEAVKRDLIAFGCEAEKIVVTPNGIDARFTPGPAADGGYFLYVGNDKPHKNVARLVEAFGKVGGRLVLAGAPFERYRAVSGVETRGFVSDHELVALYRSAAALVLPSIEEGFGLPAAEAMACGTAVITSHAPALVEITADAALHVDATNVDALAGAMHRVGSDDALRALLAERGVERARAFTWQKCAAGTLDGYRKS